MSTDNTKLVIRNIGLLLSGKIEQPILDGDCLIALNGKITAWGADKDLDTEAATTEIDAHGVTLAPGLISCSPGSCCVVQLDCLGMPHKGLQLGSLRDELRWLMGNGC